MSFLLRGRMVGLGYGRAGAARQAPSLCSFPYSPSKNVFSDLTRE
jgi:hypothetical protein